jgi:hypothetical protein
LMSFLFPGNKISVCVTHRFSYQYYIIAHCLIHSDSWINHVTV